MRLLLQFVTLIILTFTGFSQTRCDIIRKNIWTILDYPLH